MAYSLKKTTFVTTLFAVAVALASCGSSSLQPGGPKLPGDSGIDTDTSPDIGPDTSPDARSDACGVVNAGTKGEVPSEHRMTATACQPSPTPPIPDAGLMSCTADSDCTADAAYTTFGRCLHGTCSFDQCLTDSDCGTGVCGCSTDYYGGNAAYHPNICVSANCHVDSDCGAGGFCSPSRGRCGTFEGYYCHTPSDTCVNPQNDCASCSSSYGCVYTPTVGAFVCGGLGCGG